MTRPTLWQGTFACTCGYEARAEVLGRRGHRYDELEVVEVEDDHARSAEEAAMEAHIQESYDAEARGVLDVVRCPRCGARPGLARELRRLGTYLAVLAVMTALVALLLGLTQEPLAAKAALAAASVAIAARAYVFFAAVREASDRVRLTDARPR